MPNTIICCWSSNIIIILIAFLAAVSNTTGNTEGTYPNHQPPSLPLLSTITTSAEIMQDSSQSSSSPLSSDILSLKKRLLSNDDETATTTPMMAKKRTKDDSSSVPIPTAASQQPNDNSDNSRACVTPAPSSTSAFPASTTTTTTTSNAFHGGKTKNPKMVLNMPSGITKTSKRSDYLSWDEYFLAVAVLSSKRSKDPSSGASGACIVDSENRIVGIGYNGFPRGCSDDIFPWTSSNAENDKNWLHTKHPYICHAVPNAILNKSSNNVNGCRIYVTIFPTSDCTKMIIQSRIKEVIVLESDDVNDGKDEEDEDRQASRILLQMAGVKFRYYKPHVDHVELDFVSSLSPDATTNDGVSNVLTPNKEGKENESDNDNEARRLLLEEAGYDPTASVDNINQKRNDYLNWQDYFMSMAFLTAQRSKDPNTQVGACIVSKNNRIIGLGYNGFPIGCSDDCLPWARSNKNKLHNKYVYVCHAEINAILNKGSANVEGARLYVALFPCENCAKMIIQSGIKEVIYMTDSYHDTPGCRASRILFGAAGVKLTHYIPTMQKLTVEF